MVFLVCIVACDRDPDVSPPGDSGIIADAPATSDADGDAGAPTDPCVANPCLNGGVCVGEFPGFLCTCPAGYGGEYCGAPMEEPHDHEGLHGYMGYNVDTSPDGFDMGVAFYTAVWSLVRRPLRGFQIGLPGMWITPNNRDNSNTPLCPIGTHARDHWDERGPTYADVFQTIEGGLGYWVSSRYRYGQPKFRVNSITQCYDFEIGSPGFSFHARPLEDAQLSLAQLSNRLLLPPDGLTFEQNPVNAFFGYSWMALPLTPPRDGGQPTGEHSWTLFINTTTFKGPVCYMIPQSYSRVAKTFGYSFDYGRGLDARPGILNHGAMEVAQVPRFTGVSAGGTYSKIPQLHFPTETSGRSVLVRDFRVYSKAALYDGVKAWREGGAAVSGRFASDGEHLSSFTTYTPSFRHGGERIVELDRYFETRVFDDHAWGLEWKTPSPGEYGRFPRYFKHAEGSYVPVGEDEVPAETGLRDKEFLEAPPSAPTEVVMSETWTEPGPVSGEHSADLLDGTRLTYRWYRFVDQPVFAQVGFSEAEKQNLQSLIESMHALWDIHSQYMTPPSQGNLTTLDPALLVTPPEGLEIGYVPIVVRQAVR